MDEARPELVPVGAVVDPFARRRAPLPGPHHRGSAHHRDKIAMAPGLRPENAEAVLGGVVGDALRRAGQDLPLFGRPLPAAGQGRPGTNCAARSPLRKAGMRVSCAAAPASLRFSTTPGSP